MECENAIDLLGARVSGEITPTERERLDAHLATCSQCQTIAEAFALQDEQLREAFIPHRQAAARLSERIIEGLPAPIVPQRRGLSIIPLLMAATAAALAGVVLFRLPTLSPNHPVIATREVVGLTPQSRPARPASTMLDVGTSVVTPAGLKRRLALPDGSTLYVNQNSRLTLTSDHALSLEQGEVFLDVGQQQAIPFAVMTPHRQLQGSATKFAIRANPKTTDVLVMQGQVAIEGMRETLSAGQQFIGSDNAVSPAARGSHELDWTRELMAEAESPLVPAGDHAGGSLVVVDAYGEQAKLRLRKYHVDVHIEDGFARTTIDQTFFNEENFRLEGTFYFPLPADAQLSRLAMYVDGQRMEGGMAERDHARQTYERIRYTQRDPALLEWVDGTTFKMRVFPLEGRQEKRLVLSYVQRLSTQYQQTQYAFPAGHSLNVVNDWSFSARIVNGQSMVATSPSHPTMSNIVDGKDRLLHIKAKAIKPDVDVVLNLNNPGASTSESVRWSSQVHEGFTYQMLRYRPELPTLAQRERRDWVFVFEASGARNPLIARTQIEIIRALLLNAEVGDTFNVITAGTRTHRFTPQRVPVSTTSIADAVAFLETTHLIGALNVEAALTSASIDLATAVNPHLVFIGSGIASLGEQRPAMLAKQVPSNVTFVGVGVGKQWSQAFMQNAAERTGGYVTQIQPNEPIAWRSFELASTLNTPRLLNVTVSAVVPGTKEEVNCLTFANLLTHGEELAGVLRVGPGHGMPTQWIVRGTLNGQPFERILPVNDVAGDAGYLPRAWAKLEIDRLLADTTQNNRPAIVELSKTMYVMSPYTSLLVLENEAMYREFKVDRGRKDHWANYACPERIPVIYEPDPNQRLNPADWKNDRPHENVVRQSVLTRQPADVLRYPGQAQDHMSRQTDGGTTNFFGRNGRISGTLPSSRWSEMGTPVQNMREQEEFGMKLGDVRSLSLWDTTASADGREVLYDNAPAKLAVLFDTYDADGTNGIIPTQTLAPSGLTPLSAEYSMDFADDRKKLPELLQQLEGVNETALDLDRAGGLGWLDSANSRLPVGRVTSSKDAISQRLGRIVQQGPTHYERPRFSRDERLFTDLAQYAPGLNSLPADIAARIEAEAAPRVGRQRGRIEDACRPLIDGARRPQWQRTVIDQVTIHHDGQGRYTWERQLPHGLIEQVVCDGSTLWHIYPELGLAGKRPITRYHRQDICDLLRDQLPPCDELNHQCDVVLRGERTVALVPLVEDKQTPTLEERLIFSVDGRLSERQWWSTKLKKALRREVYEQDGTIRVINIKGQETISKRSRTEGDAPNLQPDLSALVVLPLPMRAKSVTYAELGMDAQRGLYEDANRCFTYLDSESALTLITSAWAEGQSSDLETIWRECFYNRGDKRIGFMVLLASAGGNPVYQYERYPEVYEQTNLTALAAYLALPAYSTYQRMLFYGVPVVDAAQPRDFITNLTSFRALQRRWNGPYISDKYWGYHADEIQRALRFVAANDQHEWGWAVMLSMTEQLMHTPNYWGTVADAWEKLGKASGDRYVACYEQARALSEGEYHDRARVAFEKLYVETLLDGQFPAIDGSFRYAMETNDRWRSLMRELATALKEKARPLLVTLAWQAHQLDDVALADALLTEALDGLTGSNAAQTQRAAFQYLQQTNQLAAADRLMQTMLGDAQGREQPGLWRQASALADQRQQPMRAIECLENALELEYAKLPARIDIESIRRDYRRLLDHYQWLASASEALHQPLPTNLISRTIRAADRWRALDPDVVDVCNRTAKILRSTHTKAGRELAWDYLTTPLALRPNESDPWRSMAFSLQGEGELALADEAFRAAFQAEPTNAQLLWDGAQNLKQQGLITQSRQLMRQLIDGEWQPRFVPLQVQARLLIEGR